MPPPDISEQLLKAFQVLQDQWQFAVMPHAKFLFGCLAAIELVWCLGMIAMEKIGDAHSAFSAILRKFLIIGLFWTLLLNGPDWANRIIRGFQAIGQEASGAGFMSPGDIFMRGVKIAGALLANTSAAGMLVNPAASLVLAFTALLTFGCFALIAGTLLLTLVESYILISAGVFFLGFGGSNVMVPYVERFFALSISIGVKILLLYLIIGTGLGLTDQWLVIAQGVATSEQPASIALVVLGASLTYFLVCWQVPKLFSGVLGGNPALTAGDVVAFAGATASAALMAAGLVSGVGGAAAGAVAAKQGLDQVAKAASAGAGGGSRGSGGGPSDSNESDGRSFVAGVSSSNHSEAANGSQPSPPPVAPNSGGDNGVSPPSVAAAMERAGHAIEQASNSTALATQNATRTLANDGDHTAPPLMNMRGE
jgi:type IV secretion system protein TrbL